MTTSMSDFAGSRPYYQTARDTVAESQIAEFISERIGLALNKLPMIYGLDYACVRGRDSIVAWFEVKSRPTFRWHLYPTVILSVMKVQSARKLTDASGLPAFFVIRDGAHDIRAVNFEVIRRRPEWLRWGGRTLTKRDEADVEPVVHIPIGFFRPVDSDMIPSRVPSARDYFRGLR